MELQQMELVKVGPSIGQRIALRYHRGVVKRLLAFRLQLQADMEPEPWTDLQVNAVFLLWDVCNILELTQEERAIVLGEAAVVLAAELDSRPYSSPLNERQLTALSIAEEHGRVSLATYRACCPHWSDETLRLDLADLTRRGLLVKNGDKRGTSYELPR